MNYILPTSTDNNYPGMRPPCPSMHGGAGYPTGSRVIYGWLGRRLGVICGWCGGWCAYYPGRGL